MWEAKRLAEQLSASYSCIETEDLLSCFNDFVFSPKKAVDYATEVLEILDCTDPLYDLTLQIITEIER